MSTGFQWVIDNAGEISIDNQLVTAQTVSRDGTIRTTSRGGSTWTFTVKFAAGMVYTDLRQGFGTVMAKGKHVADSFTLNSIFLGKYLGDSSTLTGWTASSVSGNTVTVAGGDASSGFKLKAGDLIQLGSTGHVYEVTADVAHGSSSVTVHRPIIETGFSGSINVGPNCSFKVICTALPNIKAFDYNLGTFDGVFQFAEDMT
tara:strand:+ start:4145 stop:4750 length:606 start_codon:yes stop_codon:yes gene_type:complete